MSEMVAWTGLHGSGKTYKMTERLIARRAAGCRIVSNYGFHGSELVITADDIMEIVASQAVREIRYPIAIGIDEASMLWDCRESKAFPEVMRFLIGECRKLHIDLYFTVQHLDDVDVKLRRQVHTVIECNGLLPKVYATDPLTAEELKRPRLFLEREFRGRDYGTSKARPHFRLSWFKQAVADSYDTDKLIVTLGELLRIEWERLNKEPHIRLAVENVSQSA